ncbi:hypothetical protein [Streptomyces sp. NPDC059398]|uniref:hypothetical protein n=1 Tax=Streptomyces sp. NPDC059398 TaxID=3346820 RepID=UPI0036BE8059
MSSSTMKQPSEMPAGARARTRPVGTPLSAALERLRKWARSLLDQAERAVRDVRDERQVLRLGALETLAGAHVPQVLARFAARRRP